MPPQLYKKDIRAGTTLPVTRIKNHMKEYSIFFIKERTKILNYWASKKNVSVGIDSVIYLTGLLDSFFKELISQMAHLRVITPGDIYEILQKMLPNDFVTQLEFTYLQAFFDSEVPQKNYRGRIEQMCKEERKTSRFIVRDEGKKYLNLILNMMIIQHVNKARNYYTTDVILKYKHLHKASSDLFHEKESYVLFDYKHMNEGTYRISQYKNHRA